MRTSRGNPLISRDKQHDWVGRVAKWEEQGKSLSFLTFGKTKYCCSATPTSVSAQETRTNRLTTGPCAEKNLRSKWDVYQTPPLRAQAATGKRQKDFKSQG